LLTLVKGQVCTFFCQASFLLIHGFICHIEPSQASFKHSSVNFFPVQPIARVRGVANLVGGARGCLAAVRPCLCLKSPP